MKKNNEKDIDIKDVKSKMILGFLKRIIKLSSSMLNDKDYFSYTIMSERDYILEKTEHNNPISEKQEKTENFVRGIYLSYFNAITGKCDFLNNTGFIKSDQCSGNEHNIYYDMHMLFTENKFDGYFVVVNENYRNSVKEEKIIPSFAKITCYDPERELKYEIAPNIKNDRGYKENLDVAYNTIDKYLEGFSYLDKDKFLNENKTTIFINSYNSFLFELSENEDNCAIFTNLIKSGLFHEVFEYLQKEREGLMKKISKDSLEMNDILRKKIYGYLEKKEMAERFDLIFIDDVIINEDIEPLEKNNSKRRRL